MNTQEAINRVSEHLNGLRGYVFDFLSLSKPQSPEAALYLLKTISKLSPQLGNHIEFSTAETLNNLKDFGPYGRWIRQDPGFPDIVFQGNIAPEPGLEIKAWFPLSTEITARFRESQNRFEFDHIYVAMLAWIPEQLIFGRPRILDVCVVSGKSVAVARDTHYHNPPDYLVLEPEDTAARTRNLQQTNTNGHKWQGTEAQFREAEKIVSQWGSSGKAYRPTRDYQKLLRKLTSQYPYRLDTNFAKMDRIVHPDIEAFKTRVMQTSVGGMTISEWLRLLSKGEDDAIQEALRERLAIRSRGG